MGCCESVDSSLLKRLNPDSQSSSIQQLGKHENGFTVTSPLATNKSPVSGGTASIAIDGSDHASLPAQIMSVATQTPVTQTHGAQPAEQVHPKPPQRVNFDPSRFASCRFASSPGLKSRSALISADGKSVAVDETGNNGANGTAYTIISSVYLDLYFRGGSASPGSLLYIEIELLQCPPAGVCVAIGLADPEEFKVPVDVKYRTLTEEGKMLPGWRQGSYAYHSDDGSFCGGNINGFGWPGYGAGSVVGVGLTAEGRLFFTLNGHSLGIATDEVYEARLQPLISFQGRHQFKALANTGDRPFLYDPTTDAARPPARPAPVMHLLRLRRNNAAVEHYHVSVAATDGALPDPSRKVVLPGLCLFLHMCRARRAVRAQLEAHWRSLSLSAVAALPALDRAQLNPGTFDGACRQQRNNFTGDLLAAGRNDCYAHNTPFLYYVTDYAAEVYSAQLAALLQAAGVPPHALLVAPIKGERRADKKAAEEYSHRLPGYPHAWVWDVVRASVVFDSEAQLISFYEHLCAYCERYTEVYTNMTAPDGSNNSAADLSHNCTLRLLRVKNRFARPSISGYRDLLLSLQLRMQTQKSRNGSTVRYRVTPHPFVHCCELQLHLRPVERLAHELRAHRIYEYFRVHLGGPAAAKVEAQLERLTPYIESVPLQYTADMPPNVEEVAERELVQAVLQRGDALDMRACADLLRRLGHLRAAVPLGKALLAQLEAKEGAGSAAVAVEAVSLAALLQSAGDSEGAEALRQRVAAGRDLSAEFLQMAQRFLLCRVQLGEYWQSVSTGLIERRPNIDEVSLPGPDCFRAEVRQMRFQGDRPVRNLVELYESANMTVGVFQHKLYTALRRANLPLSTLSLAPLKGQDRAVEKARDDYAAREPGTAVAWLFDIVRASITLEEEAQIEALLAALLDGPPDPDFCVVRLKNRFLRPTPGGFRDLNMNIRVQPLAERPFSHICELQVHHSGLEEKAHALDSHRMYEFFRSYFKGNTSTVDRRLLELQRVIGYVQGPSVTLDALTGAVIAGDRAQDLRDCIELLLFMGERQRAVMMATALLQGAEREHGPAAAETLDGSALLGELLQGVEDLPGAEHYMRRALEGREALLGMHDPLTLASVHSLGQLLLATGDMSGGRALLERAVASRERVLGPEHADTYASWDALGAAQLAQAQSLEGQEQQQLVQQAQELLGRALVGRETLLGPMHADTLSSVHHCGEARAALGNSEYETARTLLERAASGRERLLGPDHADTLVSQWAIARLLETPAASEALRAAVKKYNRSYFAPLLRSAGLKHCGAQFLQQLFQAIIDMDGRADEEIGNAEGVIEVIVELLVSRLATESLELAETISQAVARSMLGSDPRRQRYGATGGCEAFTAILQSPRCLESARLAEHVLSALSEMTMDVKYAASKQRVVAAGACEVVVPVIRQHYLTAPIIALQGGRLVAQLMTGFQEHKLRFEAIGTKEFVEEVLSELEKEPLASMKHTREARSAFFDCRGKFN